MSSFTVTLRTPPSLNNAYANKAPHVDPVSGKLIIGRRKSADLKVWQREAISEIYAQVTAAHRILGPISVSIALPADMQGDIDNRIKAVLDALVASQRIADDRNVWEVTARRVTGVVASDRCVVIVESFSA